ncbi:MAG TPA: hypothetical protein VLU06_13115 [Thermoanaerobaculia bacterium]|nr:hypothetical protein [Thermoanaerobaculia bacterium]
MTRRAVEAILPSREPVRQQVPSKRQAKVLVELTGIEPATS